MKLVLHIGTEKTGTTSIQAWLEANRAGLSQQGVFLSSVLDRPSNCALAHAFQDSVDPYLLPMGITTLAQVKAFRERLTKALAKEVATSASTHDSMVISSEQLQSRLLSAREVDVLADVLGRLFGVVTVVCYLRPQIDMRRSLYSTLVRMGYTGPLEGFDAEIDETSLYYNHESLADRWASAFGRDRLVLREYGRGKLHDGDIVRDFAKVALPDLDPNELEFPRGDQNSALSGAHLAAYRAINRILPFSDGKGGLKKGNARAKRIINAALDPIAANLKFLLVSPREQRVGAAIEARFATSNRRLSEAYFDGSLFATESQHASEQRDRSRIDV